MEHRQSLSPRSSVARASHSWLVVGKPSSTLEALYRSTLTKKDSKMEISARNQIRGRITSIKHGAVMAEVVIDIETQELTSTITLGSLERLGLKVGDRVTAFIKASDVLIGK